MKPIIALALVLGLLMENRLPAAGSKQDRALVALVSRHLIGMAKLDGKHTSLLALHGTYTKMLVDAYDLSGGKLKQVWSWGGDNESPRARGQGMHGMHAADLDGDGLSLSTTTHQTDDGGNETVILS